MRRIVCLVAGVLLVAPSLGSDAPKEYDGTAEADAIAGTWKPTRLLTSGESFDAEWMFGEMMTCRSGTYFVGDTLRGSYRTDPRALPAHLDRTPSHGPCEGRTIRCIYRLEGDTLTVAFRGDGKRPTEFDDATATLTFKRVK
jgi:uncharacterized protein (TIGR03067 family)